MNEEQFYELYRVLDRIASALEHSLQREGSPPYAGHVSNHDTEADRKVPTRREYHE